jgi:hypothetical protein
VTSISAASKSPWPVLNPASTVSISVPTAIDVHQALKAVGPLDPVRLLFPHLVVRPRRRSQWSRADVLISGERSRGSAGLSVGIPTLRETQQRRRPTGSDSVAREPSSLRSTPSRTRGIDQGVSGKRSRHTTAANSGYRATLVDAISGL